MLPADHDLEEKLRAAIFANVSKIENVRFYCGGYGEFDGLCARVAHQIKGEFATGETVDVTPYINMEEKLKRVMESNLYDAVVYPPLEKVPYKFAIARRNEWMVRQADLIFAYVTVFWGGAAKTLAYAQRQKKRIVTLT